MSEETNIELEEIVEPLETEVVEQESNETEQEVQEEVIPERPWKKEKTVPDTIPYSRFSEVNAEKRILERQLAEYEQKFSKYSQLEEKTKEITSVDELTSKIGEMDINEYTQTLLKIARNNFEEDNRKVQETARIQKIEKDISDNFVAKLEVAAKKNPEIKDAAEYLSVNYMSQIRPEVRYAMVTDDNAPEVLFEIATDADLLNFICNANPIDAARKIARISAKYDNVQAQVKKPAEAFVPKSTPTGSPRVQGMPTTGRKLRDEDIAKLSMSDYAKAKRDGRV